MSSGYFFSSDLSIVALVHLRFSQVWFWVQLDSSTAQCRVKIPRRKVWLTPTARVPCSNDANIGERKTWTQSEFCTWKNSVRGQQPPKCICTVNHKKEPTYFCLQLRQNSTEFNVVFIVRFSDERHMCRHELHPSHLINVATLPCESPKMKNVILQWDITKENDIKCIAYASSKWTCRL